MTDDMDLLRRFAQDGSEEAFAALVKRHINLVYSVALRHSGDRQIAEEITQTVFIILARKAASLSAQTIVSGWLCRTARFAASRALITQQRRQRREKEASMQIPLPESDAWLQIEPLLEAAMGQLPEKDQDALVLRFFQGHNFKEVSIALGTTEAGAKMRVTRALEKLRAFLSARGIALSTVVIAAALSAHSIQAAPPSLAAGAINAAVNGPAATSSTLSLVKQTLTFMAWTKFKTVAALSAAAMIIGGAGLVASRSRPHTAAKATAVADRSSPEAAVQSFIDAAARGDLDAILASGTPEEANRLTALMEGKSSDEIKEGEKRWAKGMADYTITQKDVVSSDEIHVHIHATPSVDALHSGKVVLVLKKVGSEWKMAGPE